MKDTPSMRQYKEIKEKYPDCILFFRMGDFYETFEDDAVITSKILDIVLTSRSKGEDKTPMAGIPHHALLAYIPKMIQAGYKVALCEQMENPKEVKGIVRRDVVKVITPGTVIESEIQNPKKPIYVMALFIDPKMKQGENIGVSYIDVSKGSFTVYESKDSKKIAEIVENIAPQEIILSEDLLTKINGLEISSYNPLFNILKKSAISYVGSYDFQSGDRYLLEHFSITSFKGFFEGNFPAAIGAGGALLKYIEDSQKSKVLNIEKIDVLRFNDRMYLDPATVINLELLSNSTVSFEKQTSLLDVLDKTKTSMGARLLRYSILYPLLDKKEIQKRLDSVDYFVKTSLLSDFREILSKITDIERISARISFLSPSPKDFLSLKYSLQHFLSLIDTCKNEQLPVLLEGLLHDQGIAMHAEEIIARIDSVINDEASQVITNGDVIKPGVDTQLDELKYLLKNGKGWIRQFQENEIKKSGINSLKVHYNKVFGYYIEISNAHKEKIPTDYIRKQTLVNAERYITQDLKDKEDMILNAQDRIIQIETKIFSDFKQEMLCYISDLKKIADNIAYIDMLANFASISNEYGYIKPEIVEDKVKKPIDIKNGRHPVIERSLERINYIPNDVYLDCAQEQILLITGPNMAGKSSILRMCAMICMMMQIGCFVPADEARLSLVDRIFSRVGARDSLSKGESTFMVEMNETANILNNATQDSLIILDEIGRGTSTYDGVSIAYAVIEYIHEFIGAKTMFATHYHELIDMEYMYKRLRNYNILVKEDKEDIIFLRKLAKGGTDKSYGIHVAKIAGVPKEVIKRARNVLSEYEKIKEEIKKADIPPLLSLMGDTNESMVNDEVILKDERLEQVEGLINPLEMDSLKPIDALNILYKIREALNHD